MQKYVTNNIRYFQFKILQDRFEIIQLSAFEDVTVRPEIEKSFFIESNMIVHF